jgi:hypothetical protein
MTYDRPLPSIRQLKKLAEWDGPFPLKSYRMVISAERYGFDENLIQFLQLFPHNTVFQNRDDFVEQCQDLETQLRPKEAEDAHAGSRAWLGDWDISW